jgi:hypothetical protein
MRWMDRGEAVGIGVVVRGVGRRVFIPQQVTAKSIVK